MTVDWLVNEAALIRDWNGQVAPSDIAKKLGCTELAVRVRASVLRARGVDMFDYRRQAPVGEERPLTDVEKTIIREWLVGTKGPAIADMVGSTDRFVYMTVTFLRDKGHDLPDRALRRPLVLAEREAAAIEPEREEGADEDQKETAADRKFSAPMRPWDVGPRPKTCQWLYGNPRKRKFCGKKVKQPTAASPKESSYCDDHHARCWHKPRGRAI